MEAQNQSTEKGCKRCCTRLTCSISKFWQRIKRMKWWGWVLSVIALFIFLVGLERCVCALYWRINQRGTEYEITDQVSYLERNYRSTPLSNSILYFEAMFNRDYYHEGYLVDKSVNKIIDTVDWIATSDDTLFVVAKDGLRGFRNRYTGELEIPYKYKQAWVFSDGVAAVVDEMRQLFFINHEGKVVMNKVFDCQPVGVNGCVFHYNHCIMAQAEDSLGLIDRNGGWVVRPEWRSIVWRGFYWELRTDDKIMLLDPALKTIMPATPCDKLTGKTKEYQNKHADRLPSIA